MRNWLLVSRVAGFAPLWIAMIPITSRQLFRHQDTLANIHAGQKPENSLTAFSSKPGPLSWQDEWLNIISFKE
jgi:hypothetical protein